MADISRWRCGWDASWANSNWWSTLRASSLAPNWARWKDPKMVTRVKARRRTVIETKGPTSASSLTSWTSDLAKGRTHRYA